MAFDIRGEVAQLRDAIADGEGGVFQVEGHFARRMLYVPMEDADFSRRTPFAADGWTSDA
jgi:hypothetical protein